MDKSGIYARDSLSSISVILSYIPKIPDFRKYVTFDLIGGKNKSVMISISLILSYIPKIPDFRKYVTFDLIGGKNKSVMKPRT